MTGAARRRDIFHSDLGAVALVVALLLALVAGGAVWFSSSSGGEGLARAASPRSDKPTATLRVLRPGGTVQRRGESKVRPARDEQVLRQGDIVRTDTTGLLEIDYADGSLTRLSTSAEFTIERLTEERGGRQTRGGLTVGESWSRAAKVTETGSFEVRSGGTVAAVEGTAFLFSCVATGTDRTCTVIDVVDDVRVSTTDGSQVQLTPATGVISHNDVLGVPRRYTREELLTNQFVQDNLALDFAAGKGLGAGDLPASTAGESPAGAIPPFVAPTPGGLPADVLGSNLAPTDTALPPTPTTTTPATPTTTTPATTTTTPPPPSDPRCTDGGWTRSVGANGRTFVDEQACSDFAVAGGQFAVAGNGVFIVPRGSAVTLSAISDQACNTLEFGYLVQLDESTTTSATVGGIRQGEPCGGSLGSGSPPVFETAVLLRVFLQDDSCDATRFVSDGDHAAQTSASTVAIMDAGSDCSSVQTPRPPVLGQAVRNFDLLVTVSIGAQPESASARYGLAIRSARGLSTEVLRATSSAGRGGRRRAHPPRADRNVERFVRS